MIPETISDDAVGMMREVDVEMTSLTKVGLPKSPLQHRSRYDLAKSVPSLSIDTQAQYLLLLMTGVPTQCP